MMHDPTEPQKNQGFLGAWSISKKNRRNYVRQEIQAEHPLIELIGAGYSAGFVSLSTSYRAGGGQAE
jgi:hypothetical protein